MESQTLVKLLAKKCVSRQFFKICRLNSFETSGQIEDYFWENGDFQGLKWCSPEDIIELESFINAKLIRLGRQWKIPRNLLRSESIVPIADFLMGKELLPTKQMDILIASSKIYTNMRPFTLFEMAPKRAMTEKNLRGLRTYSIARMAKRLRSLQVLREDLLLNYELDINSDLINIDETWAQQINERANSRFTPEFLAWLFGIYLDENFSLLGRPGEVLAGNFIGNRHYWSGFYLLKKEFAAALDFDAFLGETFRLLNNGAEEDWSLDFKTFVSHFLGKTHDVQVDVLLPVVAKILLRELGLQVGEDGKLLFPAQEQSLFRSYCYEALEAIGEPTSKEGIRLKMSEMHPEVYVDLAGFGAVMLEEYGFSRYKNVFGLKKWYPNGGGSLKYQDPSIIAKIEKKFPVRSLDFWESYWNERWKALMDFVNVHSRLPKNRATGEEAVLRKFWKMQASRCSRGKLDPDYQALLNELRRRFPHNNKVHWKVDWDSRFGKIKAFAEAHGVPPHREGTGEEKTMNGWLQAQRHRMKKGNLDRRQEILIQRFDEVYHLKSPQYFERHWEKKFKELEAFGHTHSRLPREVIKEEKSLNRWFAAQRLRMNRGELSRRQYKLIQDLIARYPLKGIDYLKACWHEKCSEVERFAEAHSRLPKSTIVEERPLYKWLSNQKLQGTRGRLDSQQLARLERISGEFQVADHFEKYFDMRFAELKKFVAAHSRLPRKAALSELSLYIWYMEQLRRAEAGKKDSRQHKLLKELCEPYQEVKPDWKERFRQVRAFAETHSRLPKRTALTQEEKVLNRWFMGQKARMKNGTLVRREVKLIKYLIKRYGSGPVGRKLEISQVQ